MKKILSKRLFISEILIILAVAALSLLPLLDIRYTAYYYYGASLITLLLAIAHGLLFRRSVIDFGKPVYELRITVILFLVAAIIAFALTRYFHLNPQFLTYLFPFLIPLVCRLAYREFVKAFPILTLLLLLLVADSVKAQKIVFTKVGANEDNPTARIFGITQDAEGYMWFASNGLLKFDGYEYIRYSNDPLNNNSIISNQVTCVFAAKDGMIWIGTDGKGLDKFDPVRGSFTHYKHQPKIATSLANDQVRAIAADKDGNIWVGTQEGLDMLDPKSGNFRHFLHSDQSSSISDNWINSILVDHDGIVWVGTGAAADEKKPAPGPDEGGLNRFEKSTATFTRFLKADQHGLLNNTIRAIYEDSKNNLWIGTGANLLFALDRKQATFQYYPPDQGAISQAAAPPEKKSTSTPEDYVTFIGEDAAGALWIGSKSNGVNRFDHRSGKLSHYDESDGADNSAIAAYSSADGLFWISSNTGALYKIDPILNTIPHYPASGPVFAIYKDAAGSLWIGTSNGLYRNDPGGSSQRFSYDPFNLSSLSNNIVFSINEDSQNRLWIGTDGGGLNVFNKFTRSFSSYLNEKTNKQSIASNVVYATCDENDRSIWVGTQNGLDLLDKTSGRFTHYIHDSRDSGSIGNNFIEAIIRDHENTIWVGSGYKGGINKLDRASNKFKHFLNGRSIYSLFEDHTHSIWAGTDSGLYYRTASAAEFLPFMNPNLDLSRASVIAIVEDLKGKLWINTSLGIVELDEKRAVLGLYGKRYGIGVSSFVLRAGFADNTGQIYFSGNDGYYAFDQNFLIPNIKSPNLIVTDFRLMDQSVRAGTGPLRGEINKTDELRLSYKQNVFSFDFAALDYTSPEDNQHFFMLENYDNGWHKSGTDRKAYYFNVPPGHYTFRVKGYNGNGFGTEKRIEIYIRPPWWQTWWAYTLFAVVLGSIIWGIVYYRGRKLRMKNKELEEMVSERTNELQQSLQDLKATQSQLVQVEKMASLGELTAGIAHEIQNPLNFVNNFSELNAEMITEMKTELLSGKTKEAIALAESIEENQNKITHHGKRADGIVKGMLQHSRKSTGMKEATDIVALADECIRLSYHGLRAKEKSFNASIQTAFDNNLGKVNVISQDLGRVFLNLMNNAFYSVMQKKKELKENYEPTVFVSINGLRAENKVVILIRDNGLGIPQKVVDKIFQPFFTTKPTGQGTGLGLSLSYDIVKAHGGQITVESKEGEGATFTITIPAY